MPVNSLSELVLALEERLEEISNPRAIKIVEGNAMAEMLDDVDLNDVPEEHLSAFATVRARGRNEGEMRAILFVLAWIEREIQCL